MPPPRRSKPRSPEHKALGEAVRLLRLECGLTQEQLVDLVKTDIGQIGGIERGTRNPSFETLVRIADALETRPGVIVGLADRFLDERGGGAQPATSD